MSIAPMIDAKKAASELAELRLLSAQLNRELFDKCCELQRDPDSVDLKALATLAGRVRTTEQRKRLLEELLALQESFAAGAGQGR